MKRINFILILTICAQNIFAQNDSLLKISMRDQANEMVDAFVNSNYDKLLDFTYPEIISIAGGRDILKDMIASLMKDMSDQGYTLDSAKVGEPGNIFIAGKELHALINQYIYMKFPGGHMLSESALLAVTSDDGAHWYFLDIKQLTPELKASFFPDFNNDLIVPEPKDPVITYD